MNAEPFFYFGFNWARQCGIAMKWLSDNNTILKMFNSLSYFVCDLENITTTQGAKELLSLGVSSNPVIPDKKRLSISTKLRSPRKDKGYNCVNRI